MASIGILIALALIVIMRLSMALDAHRRWRAAEQTETARIVAQLARRPAPEQQTLVRR